MNSIAVDAMGGDHAPGPEVSGAVAAVRKGDVRVLLVGDRARLREELAAHGAESESRIAVVHASQVVAMSDSPAQAYRQKTDSSLRVAFNLVKEGRAQALVSAGNSGAVLAHSLFLLKRLPNVERPGIVTVFPTPTGRLVLCDMGANVEVKPTMLAQFGILAAHYDRIEHNHPRPRVGLLSNGTEESKGTELTRSAHEILRAAAENPEAQFDYLGYVEGSEIFSGHVDVVATDGFTGNVVLKTAEGVAEAVMRMVKRALTSGFTTRMGAALVKPALLALRDSLHYSEAGGALLAGVRGVTTICHGKSDAIAMRNAITASDRFVRADLVGHLAKALSQHKLLWEETEDASEDTGQDENSTATESA
jgi:glycerol-3-phosphate acyltransferase PlsX